MDPTNGRAPASVASLVRPRHESVQAAESDQRTILGASNRDVGKPSISRAASKKCVSKHIAKCAA